MWNDLYRCSVIGVCLFAGVLLADRGSAQEQIPTPEAEVDPDAESPFLDDVAIPPERFDEFAPVAPAMQQPTEVLGGLGAGTLDRLHQPILRQDLAIHGAQSCATSNCHAGPRPGVLDPTSRRGMEYQVWVENDPHAQSWRTICSDESVVMMKRLGIMVGEQIVDQAGLDNCLACHNSTRRFNEPRLRGYPDLMSTGVTGHLATDDVNGFLREGVGCSGCHGPSEKWINTHFQYHWSARGATSQGFVEAGDLYVRARMCASCHVGDKDRDMNHDIIAAGHPALRYELATFHAWQPKHWRDAEASDRKRFESQLWLAGQVAATDASLALLEARAAGALAVSQWPELAAYDCASCHHNLGLDNARQPITDARKATAIHSSWNDAGLRWLIDYRTETGEATGEDFELLAALQRVKQVMETDAKPDSHEVAAACSEARQVLAGWFDGIPGASERHQFLSDRLGQVVASAAGKRATFQTWESAVQFYLAAVAARESWPGGWDGPLRNVADRMRVGLSYPEMIDVSRFARRDGNAPTATRTEAMSLGIELAGWLGPVQPEMMFDVEDDTPQDMRRRLNELIDEINSRWEQERMQREAAEASSRQSEPDETPPRRVPKTEDQLLEERPGAQSN